MKISSHPTPILPARPVAPNITVSTVSSGRITLILEPRSFNTTSYNVSVNGSAPISILATNDTTNYNISIGNSFIMLVSIPSNGGLPYMLNISNLINDAVYTFSVVAINCAGSSCPATMTGKPSEYFRPLNLHLKLQSMWSIKIWAID